jgi:Domain of unknown function (DUF4328)
VHAFRHFTGAVCIWVPVGDEVEGWFCNGCHSLNRRNARRCYHCGAGRSAAELQVLPLAAPRPIEPYPLPLGAPIADAAGAPAAEPGAKPSASAAPVPVPGDARTGRRWSRVGRTAPRSNPQPPAAPAHQVPTYRAGRLFAAAAIVLLALSVAVTISIAVEFGAAISGPTGLVGLFADRFGHGAEVNAFLLLSLGRALLWLVTPLAWFAWFDRAMHNVPALGLGKPESSRLGAIGWWFVPVLWFWKPFWPLIDTYRRASTPRAAGPWLPVCWWAAWIGASLLPWLGSVLTLVVVPGSVAQAARLDEITSSLTVIGCGLEIASGLLAIGVVMALQRSLAERAELVRATGVQASSVPWAVAPAAAATGTVASGMSRGPALRP